MLEKLFRLFST